MVGIGESSSATTLSATLAISQDGLLYNELIQAFTLTNALLGLVEGGVTNAVDLSGIVSGGENITNELIQTFILTNATLGIVWVLSRGVSPIPWI